MSKQQENPRHLEQLKEVSDSFYGAEYEKRDAKVSISKAVNTYVDLQDSGC